MHNFNHELNLFISSIKSFVKKFRDNRNKKNWLQKWWKNDDAVMQILDKLVQQLDIVSQLSPAEIMPGLATLFQQIAKELEEKDKKNLAEKMMSFWQSFYLQISEEESSEEIPPEWKHLDAHLLERLQEDTAMALIEEIRIKLGLPYEDTFSKMTIPDVGLGHLIKEAHKVNKEMAVLFLSHQPDHAKIKSLFDDVLKDKQYWPSSFYLEVMEFKDSISIWKMENVVNLCESSFKEYAKIRCTNDISFSELRQRMQRFIYGLYENVIYPLCYIFNLSIPDNALEKARKLLEKNEINIIDPAFEEKADLIFNKRGLHFFSSVSSRTSDSECEVNFSSPGQINKYKH